MQSTGQAAPRRVGARQDEIREAALTLFSERGYHGTGMEQIAAAVGLSPSSLYNHWKSKQDLLADIMVATMEDLLAGFAAVVDPARSATEGLRAAMDAHVRYHATHHREARVGNRELTSLADASRERVRGLRQEYATAWQQLLATGVEQGEFAEVSPRLTSFALLEAGIGVSQWYRPDGALTLDDVAHEYAEMALRLVGSRLT